MTALAGIWNFTGRPEAGASLTRMLDAQRIYGPHGNATWDSGDIAVGRALYELLPEDVHDRGPVEGGGGRFRLVADVRLDNREELAEALGIAAAEARALPDTAFVMRAWERWGEDCFDRLYGDYAFALWDRPGRRLVLARDPLGGRPLHYHRGSSFIAFASMPKGLHALPGVPVAPDEAHTIEFLALLPEIGPQTFFESVLRVEPGHFTVFTAGSQTSHRHWRPDRHSIAPWRGNDAVEGLREHLDRAVSTRLRGCGGKVGAHLSAGLDSSAVASTAARLLAGGGEVVAFTAVPRQDYRGHLPAGRIGDEGPLAAATAALYPNMHHRLVRMAGSVIDAWDRDFHLLERPLYNSINQRWVNAINAEAREEGIGVVLTGATGNATISYSGIELFPELLRRGEWGLLLREIRALVGNGHARWRGALATTFGPWLPAPALLLLNRMFGRPIPELKDYSVLNPRRVEALALQRRGLGNDMSYRERSDGVETRLWHLLRFDTGNYQKAGLGGWGVDVRDPTADRRLIEYCLSLPTRLFLANGEPRSLGKRALADRLPRAVLDERGRGFQAADWREVLTAASIDIRAEIERLREVPPAASALDLDRMRKLADELASGSVDETDDGTQYRLALMRGLAVGHFLRRAHTSES